MLKACKIYLKFVIIVIMFNPLTFGSLMGFLTSTVISHPRSPVAKYRPQIKVFKKVQILPQIKFFYKKGERVFTCHHWLAMLALLFLAFLFFQQYTFVKGFLVGGIGQGLTFRDRFEFRESH